MSHLLAVSTLSPQHRYRTEEIAEAADRLWLSQTDDRTRSAALKILKGADIRERFSVVPLETVFSPLSFQEKNEDRKSTRLNSSHSQQSRMPSSA